MRNKKMKFHILTEKYLLYTFFKHVTRGFMSFECIPIFMAMTNSQGNWFNNMY